MVKIVQFFLKHILNSIDAILIFTKDVSEQDFYDNREKFDAVVRNLEIIGEAAKNVDESMRNKLSNIPWREMAGMRDNLIHEYFGVDKTEVWKTVEKDIPELKEMSEKAL